MQTDHRPVIIGVGIGGMTVSRALSKAQIPHILIGSPPDDTPRPGESLNLEGTLLLYKHFPDLAHHYFRKSLGVAYLGEHVVSCGFVNDHHPIKKWVFNIVGHNRPDELLHFDRIAFDRELYQSVTASQYCTVINEFVTEVIYDSDSDRIDQLRLANGVTLSPRFIYDATNRGAVISRALKLKSEPLSEVHRAVYTHYHNGTGKPLPDFYDVPWERSTNILGLYPDIDGIHAIAWCIPLGSYVSIGVTTLGDTDPNAYPEEVLLNIVEEAFKRRGICYRERYPETTVIKSHPNQFFVQERAYGTNWLLVGAAFISICWISSAGIGSGLAVADIAAPILDNPQKYGAIYERHLRHLVEMHRTLDWFVEAPYQSLTTDAIGRQMDKIFLHNARRMLMASRLDRNKLRWAVCEGLLFISRHVPFISDSCRPHHVPQFAQQTETLFANWQ